MIGRKIIECQQFLSIFLKTLSGFGILGIVGLKEQIKRFLGIFPGLGDPDVMETLFRLSECVWKVCLIRLPSCEPNNVDYGVGQGLFSMPPRNPTHHRQRPAWVI